MLSKLQMKELATISGQARGEFCSVRCKCGEVRQLSSNKSQV